MLQVRRIESILVAETVAEYDDSIEKVTDSITAANIFRTIIGNSPREIFGVLLLGGKHNVIGYEQISVGTVNSSLVHPREVFGSAVRLGAVAIIVAHNHPSGNPEPSPEDVDVTARLQKSGKLLGISMLDHIIVGEEHFSSFSGNWSIESIPSDTEKGNIASEL